MEDNIEIPQKIKNRAKIKKIKNPAVLLLGIYPKRSKSLIQNDIGTFISLQHYLLQLRYGNNLCPMMDEWIKKM